MISKSVWSSLAFEALRKHLLKDGDLCPYKALFEAMSINPQKEGYGYVFTARKQFEQEFDCVLQPLRGEGIERLPPPAVVCRGSADLRRTRRGINRAIKRQTTIVQPEKQAMLTRAERSTHLVQLSQMGIVAHCLKPGQQNKVRQAVNASDQRLPVEKTLALFQDGK